ncbi:unnamed protein product [Microthlaspi erraticum]|uniref:Uncharacterized protein n=1 Tax=Microthlaspi erraticum TaxID=1685480 RepID=A0A6D2JW32_9BRAS|nr:unnamed protein product [Microthlaspi erraticum]
MVCFCFLVDQKKEVKGSKPAAGMCSRCGRCARVADMKTSTSVFKIWWETASKRRVYTTIEWVDRLFESGTALLHIGFDEDQEYFRSYFLI